MSITGIENLFVPPQGDISQLVGDKTDVSQIQQLHEQIQQNIKDVEQ